jgi:hypothetical protein
VKLYQLVLALPFMLAFGLACHAAISRGVKAVLWAWSPLASGEPEAATYERRVYHTADIAMLQVVVAAAASGLPWWLALATGSGLWAWAGVLAIGAVVAFDVLRWERVAVSAQNLWFQRGFRGKVHQVVLENIRDLSVEEAPTGGFTLRHGRHNRLVRLQVRMKDKRVIALPKTDASAGTEAVEAVANHLRMRLQQFRDKDRPAREPAGGCALASRLRRGRRPAPGARPAARRQRPQGRGALAARPAESPRDFRRACSGARWENSADECAAQRPGHLRRFDSPATPRPHRGRDGEPGRRHRRVADGARAPAQQRQRLSLPL